MASQVLSFVAVSGHIPLDIFYLAVPVTVMMCGLPGELSDSVMVAVRVPVSPRAGAKVTWMVQEEKLEINSPAKQPLLS
jgi:hypothetical protein